MVYISNYRKSILNGGYYVCKKCINIKSKQLHLYKYGVDSPSQRQDVREKYKNTCLEKYGSESYIGSEKYKSDIFNKFGVDHPSKSDVIKSKKINTCLKNHNVEYPTQSSEVIVKIREKNIQKYGVDWISKSEYYKNKFKSTCLEKYGVENPFMFEKFKDKIRNTCLQKYGAENYAQSEEGKEKNVSTCLEKYGTKYTFNCDDIRNKIKMTMLERYGVENCSQSEFINAKKEKTGFKPHKLNNLISYQGSYELDFLEKYIDLLKIERGPRIKYKFNDKDRYYFPDFYIEDLNLIIEIKSSWFLNKNLDMNNVKQKACVENGYDFIFIVDKNYELFNDKI